MKKLFIIFIPFLLFALDSDLDGVPDNIDLCPNTPFLEIVNKNGCSKSQLKQKIKFNFSVGYEIDRYKNYKTAKSIFYSISAKKQDLKISLYLSLLKDGYTPGYRLNNIISSIYFYKNLNNFSFKTGFKYYTPTYFNKQADYALFLQGIYIINNYLDITLSEQFKIYTENNQKYSHTIYSALDFFYNNFAISPYFYKENSSSNTSKWYQYIGIYISWNINKRTSLSIDYSFETNSPKNNSIITTINYYF